MMRTTLARRRTNLGGPTVDARRPASRSDGPRQVMHGSSEDKNTGDDSDKDKSASYDSEGADDEVAEA